MRVPYADYFGEFGGRYVAEVLRGPLDALEDAYKAAMDDPGFYAEFQDLLEHFVGRPTPMMFAKNASAENGGADIYIKLEGLANTGAHKINNAIGQALVAKRMGKRRIIAETGAGQHGYATAAVCAKLGFECTVYMGEVDVARQRPNVFWMELFGADVVPVAAGSRTLKDAVNEALRDWASSYEDTHYLIGSALGPSPYPTMVHQFQSVVGEEVVSRLADLDCDPDLLVACVGGGSNALGFFAPYIEASAPRLLGVEAGGFGLLPGGHASRLTGPGRTGVVQGYKSLFLLDDDGLVQGTHSVSAGLDYPGVGPQLAHLGKTGRVEFSTASDEEALEALRFFARTEGVVFALESAHAGAACLKEARALGPGKSVVVNMSGRGDKDLFISAPVIQPEAWRAFLLDQAAAIPEGGDLHGGKRGAI